MVDAYIAFISIVVLVPIALFAFFRSVGPGKKNNETANFHNIPKLETKVEATRSWSKPLEKLAVQYDVVRLMEKISVRDSGLILTHVILISRKYYLEL